MTRQLTPAEMAQYSAMLVGLSQDPQFRGVMAPMIAKKYPAHAGAFSDVAMTNRMVAFERRQAQKESETEMRRYQAQIEDQRKELIKSGRYTEEQTAEIKKVMERYHLDDYNAGAVLYAHERTPEVPPFPMPSQRPSATWEFPSIEGEDGKVIPFADFVKDPNRAAENAAYRVIADFKQKRLPMVAR